MQPDLTPSEREHYETLKRLVGIGPSAASLMNGREAAAYIGWAESTLCKSRLLGNGPAYLKVGKSVRYRKSELDAWLAGRSRRSTSDAGAAA